MNDFKKELSRRQVKTVGRRWLFVPYDQLSDKIGPLSREDPGSLGIVLVENPWKAARRPYHQQKLALILANLRHFALEQAQRGVAVRHVIAEGPYATALEPLIPELGTLRVMAPAERELRKDLEKLVDRGSLELLPHEGWLSTAKQFTETESESKKRLATADTDDGRENPGNMANRERDWTEAQPPAPSAATRRCLQHTGASAQGWPAWTPLFQVCGPKGTAITSQGS